MLDLLLLEYSYVQNSRIMMNKFEKSLELAKQKVFELIPEIPDLDVVLILDAEKTIPELGIGGNYRKEYNCISIYIDPEHKHIQENYAEEILKSFAHEYIHATREQKIPWENCTLLEALISEGLAQNFEFEITGKKPLYASSLSETEILENFKKSELLLNETNFDYSEWFFGSGTEIKKWTGYALGFWLVEKYCNKVSKKPHELVHQPSNEFI